MNFAHGSHARPFIGLAQVQAQAFLSTKLITNGQKNSPAIEDTRFVCYQNFRDEIDRIISSINCKIASRDVLMLSRMNEILWRVRHYILSAMLAVVILPAILQFSAPTIEATFTPKQIHPHRDDLWAIEFNPKLPFWWVVPKFDRDIATLTTARFTENGQEFGLKNHVIPYEMSKRVPDTKYWNYLRSKGRMKEMGLSSPNMIYFAMGDTEDPRQNGKIYAISAPAELARFIPILAEFTVGFGILMLILASRHHPIFPGIGYFFRRYAGYLAGIVFGGWLYVMLTPPVIEHKFSANEIYPLHNNAWLASFKGEVPPWRMIKAHDFLDRIKSENDFFENGKVFTGANFDCLQEYPHRDMQVKCWDYTYENFYTDISALNPETQKIVKGMMIDAMMNPKLHHLILFRLPPGEDPRYSGAEYQVKTKLVLTRTISLYTLSACLLLLLPMIWQYSRRGIFQKRLSLCVSAGIISLVTSIAIFYGSIFNASPEYWADSFGYLELNIYRPIGTWAFFQFVRLLGNFDHHLIWVQYFMVVMSISLMCWASAKLLRHYWIFPIFISIFLSEFLFLTWTSNPWSPLIYSALSEPLFISAFSLSLACLYVVITTDSPRSKLWASLGVGLFLGIADITRAIGLAFFVMIPLYAIWHLYAARQWRETAQHTICMVMPIIFVLFGQSAFQKIHFGQWGGGGGGAGLFLLTQSSAIISAERAARLPVPDSAEGRDQKQLAINLAQQVDPILGKFHAASWPYERAMIWSWDTENSFETIMHDFSPNMRGIHHATDELFGQFYPGLQNSPDFGIHKERLMRNTAIAIIAAHPVDFTLHILSEILIAKLYLGNGWFGTVNFFLPFTCLTVFFTILVLWRPHRRDYAGLAISGLTTLAYIIGVCIMEPPFPRYILIAQFSALIVVFGSIFQLLCEIRHWLSQPKWNKRFFGIGRHAQP